MDIKQLVVLLENEKTWKETNFYKKQLQQENNEIIEGLLLNLNEIIFNKKYPPMARLGAVRLLKNCLEAGNEYFNWMITEGDFIDKLSEFARIKQNTQIFSTKPDKREQQVSVTLFTYLIEGFLFWSIWFPGTKFSEIYSKLKAEGVQFPDILKVQIFKSELEHLYVGGQFQKKARQTDTGQQRSQQNQQVTAGQGIQISSEAIEEKILQFQNGVELMVGMLKDMNEATDDLQMFQDQFAPFQEFSDKVLESHQPIEGELQRRLFDSVELCMEIIQHLEDFFTQKIKFETMKQEILNKCQNINQQQEEEMKRENMRQLQLEEEQKLMRQIQEDQKREEDRRKKSEEDRKIKKSEEDRQLQQKNLREQEEKQRQQQQEEQIKSQREKKMQEDLKKQQEAENIQRQKQFEEQQKKERELEENRQKERQEQLRKQQENENNIKRQKEHEEQLKKQREQEELFQRQKEQEELIQRQNEEQIFQQQRDLEERRQRMGGNQKANQPKMGSKIKEESEEYEDEEERKSHSQYQGSRGNPNNQFSKKTHSQHPSGQYGSMYKKENSLENELDDEQDFYLDSHKNKQNNSQIQPPINANQKDDLRNHQQQQIKNTLESQNQGNLPYTNSMASKNPFTNNKQTAPNSNIFQKTDYQNNHNDPIVQMAAYPSHPKGTTNYFGVEEYYEPPQKQVRDPQNNSRVNFDDSRNLSDDDEYGRKNQGQYNSKLEQSGNIEADDNANTQIHYLNNTMIPKTKPKEEGNRILAGKQPSPLQSSQNDSYQINTNKKKTNFPSGFEQVEFEQPGTLMNQVQNFQNIRHDPFVSNAQNKDQVSAQWGRDKQSIGDNDLKSQLQELRRDKEIEVNKLEMENKALNMKLRSFEANLMDKDSRDNNQIKSLIVEKQDLEKRVQEKDKIIFQQKQLGEQLTREAEQSRQIAKQAEQQKQEQMQILATKKKEMEEEHQRTKAQLADYMENTQKNAHAHLDLLQKNLNQTEVELSKYQQELQQRELENSDLRSEIRLLKSKEPGLNQGLMKEKESKISELKSKVEVLSREINFREDKITDLSDENLSLRKAVEDQRQDVATTESEVHIYKENLMQKDIEIGKLKQTIFEKDQALYSKEQNIIALEQAIAKKKEIIEQFKLSSEAQMRKFHDNFDESDQTIKELQRQKEDLEDRIESISQQHQEDMNRIIAASKMNEEEKKMYKQIIDEAEKLKSEKYAATLKEQNQQQQILQYQRNLAHLKKENQDQEKNLEDLVMTNNLLTKKLYEKDEQYQRDQEQKQRDLEMKERKHAAEIKYTRQAVETLKLEKQRKEVDLGRNLETLRKENELLLQNLKTKSFLSPDVSATRIFSPLVKYELDSNEIEKMTRSNANINQDQQPAVSAQQNKTQLAFNPFLANSMNNPSQKHGNDQGVGDELYSYNKNADSLNVSTHSIKPKRNYPKNFMGREIPYNSTYFSYLRTDKAQLYRFKKSCLKNKMAIYQDNYLNVGVISEPKEIDGKLLLLLQVFFENKSLNYPLQNVAINYEGDQSISVYKKPATLPNLFNENAQHSQQIITEFNEMPFKIIQCTVSYTINGNSTQAAFPLPNSVNKFFLPVLSASVTSIEAAFSDFAHLMIRSEDLNVDKNIASSQYDYTNLFNGFLNLGNVDGMPDYQTIGGQYLAKNIDTNIWIKVNYNKKDHKVIFQAVYDNQLEEYSQTTAKYLLQTLMMIFKQ